MNNNKKTINVKYILIKLWLGLADETNKNQHSLIMPIADQLGFANRDVFGQGMFEIGQGKFSEKSGNFTVQFVGTLYNISLSLVFYLLTLITMTYDTLWHNYQL